MIDEIDRNLEKFIKKLTKHCDRLLTTGFKPDDVDRKGRCRKCAKLAFRCACAELCKIFVLDDPDMCNDFLSNSSETQMIANLSSVLNNLLDLCIHGPSIEVTTLRSVIAKPHTATHACNVVSNHLINMTLHSTERFKMDSTRLGKTLLIVSTGI